VQDLGGACWQLARAWSAKMMATEGPDGITRTLADALARGSFGSPFDFPKLLLGADAEAALVEKAQELGIVDDAGPMMAQIERYLGNGGSRCLFCEGADIRPEGWRNDDDGTVRYTVRCAKCRRRWRDVHHLAAVELIPPEEEDNDGE
jgi:hypothetical protein